MNTEDFYSISFSVVTDPSLQSSTSIIERTCRESGVSEEEIRSRSQRWGKGWDWGHLDGGEKTPEVVNKCDHCELRPQGSFPTGKGCPYKSVLKQISDDISVQLNIFVETLDFERIKSDSMGA